jgi:4-amino-4-deoxy-L-arabinose transferase-like glycosyltransferase
MFDQIKGLLVVIALVAAFFAILFLGSIIVMVIIGLLAFAGVLFVIWFFWQMAVEEIRSHKREKR